jgi:PAS domain S-box-containing protein
VVDNLPQSVFWKDTQLNYLGCNRAFARALGLVSTSAIVGKTDWDLSSKDRAEHYREDDMLVIKSEVPKYNIEEQQTRPDGSTAWLLTNKVPLRDAAGNVMGVLGMFEDITKRKQAEQLLQQSEATLASALRVAQMGHWEYDIATNMFTFNDQYYSLHGTTAQEVGGYQVSVQKFAQEFVYPEDGPIVGQATQEAIETTDPNFQVQTEARILHTDGKPRWVTVWFRVEKDEQGRTVRLHGVSQDITERKLLEQQVQTAFERRGLQVQISTQVSQSIASSTNLEELYQRVVVQVKEHFGYYYAQLLRYDADQDAVALVTGYGEIGAKMLTQGHRMKMGEGLIGTAAATGETVLRPVLENDPDWHPNPLLPETKGEVAVPIKLGDNVLGVLDVQSSVAGALSAEDQLLLEGLCGQVATAIESTRLRQEMMERLDEINRLYQAMRQEGWQAYQQSDQLPTGFMFDRIGVAPIEAASPLQENFVDIPIVFPGGQVVGSVGVADDPRRPLSPEEQDLLGQISEQIALAMESARLFDQTQAALAQSERLFEASRRLTQAQDLQELTASTVNLLDIKEINRALLVTFNYDSENNIDSLDIIANWWNGSGHAATSVGTRYGQDVMRVMPMFISPVPVFFDDTFTDNRVDETTMQLVNKLNLRAVAVLPLHVGVHQLGALFLEAEDPHHFTQEETRLFTALAPQISTVLENRRQYERAQKQAERESMLNTISQKIQSATTVEAVLQIAARELGHALGAPLTIAQLGMKAQGNGN